MHSAHVALRCRSEENADRFYNALLGLAKQTPKTLKGELSKEIFALDGPVEMQVINYKKDRLHFEIFIDADMSGADPVSHICLDVGNINDFLDKCGQLDVTVRRIPKGDKIVTFIEDFDGNLFEITG